MFAFAGASVEVPLFEVASGFAESLGLGVESGEPGLELVDPLGLGDVVLEDDDPGLGCEVAEDDDLGFADCEGFDVGFGFGFGLELDVGLGFGFGAEGTTGFTRGGGLVAAVLSREKASPCHWPARAREPAKPTFAGVHDPLVLFQYPQNAVSGGVSMQFSSRGLGKPPTRHANLVGSSDVPVSVVTFENACHAVPPCQFSRQKTSMLPPKADLSTTRFSPVSSLQRPLAACAVGLNATRERAARRAVTKKTTTILAVDTFCFNKMNQPV